MPNIATVLKAEISRLARKEVNAGTQAVRKANAQYRRDIAELKRQVVALSKQVAYLERQERKRVSKAPSAAASIEGKRFSARGLRTHRQKIGVSAADYARLIGVSAQTIYSWERGRSKPRARQFAVLVTVRALGKREALERLELLEG